MVDWTQSMQQTFEYYIVDPGTWKEVKRIDTVLSSNIDRDATTDTLETATINVTETLGECYVRIYLITIQNGITEKHCLGTFLVQTPNLSFNGYRQDLSLDAYSPLVDPELEDNTKKLKDDFVANLDENWCHFIIDLIDNANYELRLDEKSQIMFAVKQKPAAMKPVYTFNDDNSSILLPEISVNRDLYGIPNVVEVIYTASRHNYSARVVNNNPDSPVSVKSRGREIVHRVVNPNMGGMPSQLQVENYAKRTLEELSSLEYTVSFSHGYCGTRLGDCVRLNYKKAGIEDIKAKIISQSIICKTGCQVTEKATFTTNLWR